jgi:hypothetical protein
MLLHASSTPVGGGAPRCCRPFGLCTPLLGCGWDGSWLVVMAACSSRPSASVSRYTAVGDDGRLDAPEQAAYDQVLDSSAEAAWPRLSAGDVVVLRDHQTAGLAMRLARKVCAAFLLRCGRATQVVGEPVATARLLEEVG